MTDSPTEDTDDTLALSHRAREWLLAWGWVLLTTMLALATRLIRLTEPVLRWDEGWSLAHASLPWDQLWRISILEWHPPLYVALLKGWLALAGRSVAGIRSLSVLLGVLTVPLLYGVAQMWSGRRRVAAVAALLAATWPLLVYYGQVTRMYALSAFLVTAAAWFALRGLDESEGASKPPLGILRTEDLGLIVSSVAALYTLYVTLWPLAGVWLYALIRHRASHRRLARLAFCGLLVAIAYGPWLWLARETLHQRVRGGALDGIEMILGIFRYLRPTLEGLAFVYGAHGAAPVVLGAILAGGLCAWKSGGRASTTAPARLGGEMLLPALAAGISVLGVAYGAYASRWFAPRHLAPAAPFLCLGLAWSLDQLAARWRPLLPAALLLLGLVYWPTATSFVYAKTLEVVDPFDPTADYRYLSGRAGPDDLVFFNVLARAGWYENLRGPQDPAWTYAMRWDPIIEPLDEIVVRINAALERHALLWFVLYQGHYGPNAPLKEWLDAALYPAGGVWQGDTLYLAYVRPSGHWHHVVRDDRFEGGLRLVGARWTEAILGAPWALELMWKTDQPLTVPYKVFVHLADANEQLLAQHDAVLGGETNPCVAWPVGEPMADRHGLKLPNVAPGATLEVRVGLYDPNTGERLPLVEGGDSLELVTLSPR